MLRVVQNNSNPRYPFISTGNCASAGDNVWPRSDALVSQTGETLNGRQQIRADEALGFGGHPAVHN